MNRCTCSHKYTDTRVLQGIERLLLPSLQERYWSMKQVQRTLVGATVILEAPLSGSINPKPAAKAKAWLAFEY